MSSYVGTDVEFQIRKKAAASVSADLPAQLPQAIEKIQAIFGAKSKPIDPKAV